MKKNLLFLILILFQYLVAGQSAIQRASYNTASSNITYQSVDLQKNNTYQFNSGTNYQTQSVTPNHNQSTVQINSNQYVSNCQDISKYQNYNSGHNRNIIINSKISFIEKFAVFSNLNPFIKNIVFPNGKPNRKEAAINKNVLFSSLNDLGNIYVNKPIYKAPLDFKCSSSGTTTYIKPDISPDSNNNTLPHYRYKCIYGNYSDYNGLNWYSIHVASLKNLSYCMSIIRYIKNRYKLDVFVFNDFSIDMRYHIVMGKYRHYYLAENILRRIRKEMPTAFVINWSRFSQMILFQ